MSLRAKKKINRAFAAAADDAFYATHHDMVKDGKRTPIDPDDGALVQVWLKLYQDKGGAVEETIPARKKVGEAVAGCRNNEGKLLVKVIENTGDADRPIEDAEVTVAGKGKKQTKPDGKADYGTVPPGKYTVSATKEGYEPVSDAQSEPVEVVPVKTATTTVKLRQVLNQFSSDATATFNKRGPETKTIFLTFDDGTEAGTKEVFELLTQLGVAATFFCVGENVAHFEKTGEKGFFKKLYRTPSIQICNHSHTHGHQFYTSFYDSGLRINKNTLEPTASETPAGRRSVLMDFEYANIAFTEALAKDIKIPRPADPPPEFRGKLAAGKLKGYSRFLSARMPGTNLWRTGALSVEVSSFIGDRIDEAWDLTNNGYKIFGWDHEYKMNFEVGKLQIEEYKKGHDGHLDLYDGKLIELDRPTQTGQEVFEAVKSKLNGSGVLTANKLVLLMHERAFRRFGKADPEKHRSQLKRFIELCKAEGFVFDVIKNY